jgi:peptide/nickel transport system permease protein
MVVNTNPENDTSSNPVSKSPQTEFTARQERKQGYWHIVWRQLMKNKFAVIGLYCVSFLILVAVFADFLANDKPLIIKYRGKISFPIIKHYAVSLGLLNWSPEFQNKKFKTIAQELGPGDFVVFPPVKYSPNDYDLSYHITPPSHVHLLGTDETGRDILSRMIHGTRISLSVGIVAVSIYTIIGVILGAVAGYFGGWVDIVISRLIELMMTFPTFFLIITIVAFLPASIYNIMLVIGITGWTGVARFVRGEFYRVKNVDFVQAAVALGFNHFRIIFRHVLPNAVAPVFVTVTFGIAGAILLESGLSFLGFGVPPDQASWGSILSSSRQLLPEGWWLTTFPGLAIFFTIVVINLVGEGLRDAMDPRIAKL